MPVNLTSQNFSKPSASISLFRMARRPSRVKLISLSGPSMRSWIQAFCARVGDVHELDAERLAVGALADRDDLAQRAVFEAEHVIEEDLAVEIGFGEAVGARIEFLAVARRLDAERIELGVKMAAHAVGADQHQRADRIARRLVDVGRSWRLSAPLACALAAILAPTAFSTWAQLPSSAEVSSSRGVSGQLSRPQDGPSAFFLTSAGLVLQALEELLPLGVDRGRVLLVAGVEFVDVGGVGALQKRGEGKCGVRVLARHDCVLVISFAHGKRRNGRSGRTGSA